jgi:medium-chain acyl-[acyl-carrier-protein] hydrolase
MMMLFFVVFTIKNNPTGLQRHQWNCKNGYVLLTSGTAGATFGKAEGGSWLYRPAHRSVSRARLFCFPHAGVGSSVFRLWSTDLPPEVDLLAIQLPGRTARFSEPSISNLSILADAIVKEIAPYLDLPFVLFGHSMGAVLAAEVAHGLAARRLPRPHHLVLSGHRPPRWPDPHPPLGRLSDSDFVVEINRRYGVFRPKSLRNPISWLS